MQIIVDKKENACSIAFAIVFRRGSMHEPENKSGITHLIEHMVFRKAGKKTQNEIYDYLERLGVTIRATTGINFMRFSFVCRSNVFREVLNLFYDMLYEYEYSDDDLNAEKAIVSAEIEEDTVTNEKIIINKAWSDKNFSKNVLGTLESLNRITLSDLIEFKRKYLSVGGIVFLLGNVGDDDYNAVKDLFGEQPTERVECAALNRHNSRRDFKLEFVYDTYDLTDVCCTLHLRVDREIKTKTIACVQMLNSALFQGDAACVRESLRERWGYVYDVFSIVQIIDNEAVLFFSLQVDSGNLVSCIETLEQVFNDFVFDEKYYSYIKAFFCDNVILLQDNIKEKLEHYIDNCVFFGEPVSPEQLGELVKSISLEEYNEVYKKLMLDRKVYIFGNVTDLQKKAIKRCLK